MANIFKNFPAVKLPQTGGHSRMTPIAKPPLIVAKTPPLPKPKGIFK